MGLVMGFWRGQPTGRGAGLQRGPSPAADPAGALRPWHANPACGKPRWLVWALQPVLVALTLVLLCLATGTALAAPAAVPGQPTSAAGVRYRCGGDPLLARTENGAVDAVAIPNTSAGTPPGAFVVLTWRGTTLQLPRTNNAGAPSYTDGRWWWSLENPDQPRFRLRRGGIEEIPCSREP